MADTVISVSELGKRYLLGELRPGYLTLKSTLQQWTREMVRLPLELAGRQRGEKPKELWALRDVGFEVKQGEVLGIIGRNGAGKSTLLKILARITEPTVGGVRYVGKVGSLLEVGTGFHPELTGRENIFLSGAILGMKRREICHHLDEIIGFSEIEEHIDTPVKRYSSGMYTRLAFSVAAHLNPEILLVDEVLAVGDFRFQRKCLGKMQEVGTSGRTVLFISHNMTSIARLCPRTILLEGGRVISDGPSNEVIGEYLGRGAENRAMRTWPDLRQAPGNDVARLKRVSVCDESGQSNDVLDIRRPIGVEMEYVIKESGHVLIPNLHFYNEEGICVFISADTCQEWRKTRREAGTYFSTVWIPGNYLAEGSLIVGAALSTVSPLRVHFFERDAVAFQVVDSQEGDSARGDYAGEIPGVVRPLLRWKTTVLDPSDRSIS